jgi:hypothetical protein
MPPSRCLPPVEFCRGTKVPKSGQCPSGYRESGGYCARTSDRAPVAVPKRGAVSVELDVERRLLRRRAAALSSNLCSLKATAEGAGYRNQDAGSDEPSD